MGRDDARAVNCVSYSPSEAPLKVLKDSTEAPSVSALHISLVRFSSSSVGDEVTRTGLILLVVIVTSL